VYHREMRDNSHNGHQQISHVLKPAHFISEITLEGIGMWTVISESKFHAVSSIKFNADLMECVVMAVTEDQE
jgi:hypothetical protein